MGLPALLKGHDSGGARPIPGGQWEGGIVFLVSRGKAGEGDQRSLALAGVWVDSCWKIGRLQREEASGGVCGCV